MNQYADKILELETENRILKSEISHLKRLLDNAGIDYSVLSSTDNDESEALTEFINYCYQSALIMH